jgi:hypothetical protein
MRKIKMHYCKDCRKIFLFGKSNCSKCPAKLEPFPMDKTKERAVWIWWGGQVLALLIAGVIVSFYLLAGIKGSLIAPVSVVVAAILGVLSNWRTSKIIREEMERITGVKEK